MHDMRRYIFRGNMMDLIGATFRAECELAGVCSKPDSNIFGEVCEHVSSILEDV